MKYYELTLKGFDGGTDETDDKIIWIQCPDEMVIELSDKSDAIKSINEIDLKRPDGIDLTIKEKQMYINHYLCPRCDCMWDDEWDSMCDDRCPNCNASISPYKSEDLN